MSKKIYVGNLPFSASDADLSEIFSQVGQVTSARIVIDRMSGRSKGFGFIEMPNDAEADAAIQKFNQAEFDGRTITVSEARPQEPREGGGPGGGGRGPRGGGGGGGGFRRERNA